MGERILVGQSGGCTAVINASLVGIIESAGLSKSVSAVYGAWHGIEGMLEESFTDLLKQEDAVIRGLLSTPSSALGSCRYKISKSEAGRLLEILKKHDISILILIGGNDTAQTALEVSRCAHSASYPLRIIVVPKTIDNDLPVTDHTPGYGSAARFIAQVTQEVSRDTEAMHRVDSVKILEVMGRNSGWIVAASALGKMSDRDGPHLLYFPERPLNREEFLSDVERVFKKNKFVIVVVSETVRDKSGRRIGEKEEGVLKDSFGHPYMESVAAKLTRWVEDRMKVRARYDKPGTILRMSMPYVSSLDQAEAFRVGKEAVRLALSGETELMVTLVRISDNPYNCNLGKVHLGEIAGLEKKLPDSFISSSGTFVTDAFRDYALPLLGASLPKFARIKNIPVIQKD